MPMTIDRLNAIPYTKYTGPIIVNDCTYNTCCNACTKWMSKCCDMQYYRGNCCGCSNYRCYNCWFKFGFKCFIPYMCCCCFCSQRKQRKQKKREFLKYCQDKFDL